ncbi:MAG: hypothetical protein Harvfovirus3_8 [Harvfovirus sp.]|uniref:Uncharacterized protein n=1 Tax=Harvfovirus sp. TaxID=2487768 RepID=A0A3G5A414_9VIRU|nr:MAG: hypothetical protein Harvfovirus3_8 [Harvfovirus sp.]
MSVIDYSEIKKIEIADDKYKEKCRCAITNYYEPPRCYPCHNMNYYEVEKAQFLSKFIENEKIVIFFHKEINGEFPHGHNRDTKYLYITNYARCFEFTRLNCKIRSTEIKDYHREQKVIDCKFYEYNFWITEKIINFINEEPPPLSPGCNYVNKFGKHFDIDTVRPALNLIQILAKENEQLKNIIIKSSINKHLIPELSNITTKLLDHS